MARPLRELLDDYNADPSQWGVVKVESVPSTNTKNRGGTSVQELIRHRATGEELVRHTVLKPDGTVFDPPHFRQTWK